MCAPLTQVFSHQLLGCNPADPGYRYSFLSVITNQGRFFFVRIMVK